MKRLFAMLAALALLFLPTASAQAASSLAFTILVDCDDADGSSTAEPPGVTMPGGWYAVEITGACFLAYPNLDSCVLTAYTYSGGCGHPATTAVCSAAYRVLVDGQCPSFGGAGLIHHGNTGPVTARVTDCCHSDNEGYFVVTLTWTAL